MNTVRTSHFIIGIGFLLAVAVFAGRVYHIETGKSSCRVKSMDLSQKLCNARGERGDWAAIPHLTIAKMPIFNIPYEVFTVKKELSEADWVRNPGILGSRADCIYQATIAVQNNKCGYY